MKVVKLTGWILLISLFHFHAHAQAPDLVRVGNLKFAHYGAISYMSEYCGKYNLKVTERVFAKGIDIMPAIIAGEIDVAASAADAAIAGRAGGVPIFAVAGFAEGGARIVIRPDLPIKSVKDFKGRKVGVARGGAQELLLLAELAKNNLTIEHIQITTDFMQKYGVGRMQKPPKASDWVKLDLLTEAKTALGVK